MKAKSNKRSPVGSSGWFCIVYCAIGFAPTVNAKSGLSPKSPFLISHWIPSVMSASRKAVKSMMPERDVNITTPDVANRSPPIIGKCNSVCTPANRRKPAASLASCSRSGSLVTPLTTADSPTGSFAVLARLSHTSLEILRGSNFRFRFLISDLDAFSFRDAFTRSDRLTHKFKNMKTPVTTQARTVKMEDKCHEPSAV